MKDLLPNPCHLLDTAWVDLDAPDGYDDIAVDVTVEVDPGTAAGYYYANTVYFSTSRVDVRGRLSGVAYAGLQTDGYAGPGVGRVGKIARFSAWASTGAVAEPDGWSYEFEETGTGHTVLIPYPWSQGTTYRVRIRSSESRDDGRICSAFVADLETGITTRIGRLAVPRSFGKIGRPITFHERYLGASPTIEAVEPSQVLFTNMTANEGKVRSRARRHTNVFSLYKHPGRFWHEDVEEGVRSGVNVSRPSEGR